MIQSASLGFSRLGQNLEYITAIKSFLKGDIQEQDLFKTGHYIRKYNIDIHASAGIDIIPSNDFSWLDHVWDTSVLLGNIPRRYYWEGGIVPTDIYFASMIGHRKDKFEVPAMEQLPWFNTKYFYTVPEFQNMTDFIQSDNKIIQHYIEAKQFGHVTRPVLLGPMSYILLGKVVDDEEFDEEFEKFDILDEILTVYKSIFANLKRIGVKSVQIDEPHLSTDLSKIHQKLYEKSYNFIRKISDGIHITLTTGFGDVGNNTDLVNSLPVNCVHLDLHSAPKQIEGFVKSGHKKELSLGLVDGQNVFINDIEKSIKIAEFAMEHGVSNIQIGTNCSLLHCPVDLALEKKISPQNKQFLAYSKQKLQEVALITNYLNGKVDRKEVDIIANKYKELTKYSQLPEQQPPAYARKNRYARVKKQKSAINIGFFPVTALGNIPCNIDQKKNAKNPEEFMLGLIKKQQPIFDVFSTGEVDRHSLDLDYFAELADDFYITADYNHIQTNGFIIEKPPIMLGDFKYSKIEKLFDLTKLMIKNAKNPVKYRLFGPVTAFHRSFVFEGISKQKAMLKLAKFASDIILEAQKCGVKIVQIEEHSIREQMPIRISDFSPNLSGLTSIVKAAYCNISDELQVHLNVGNSDVSSYVDDLDSLDADVLLVSACRANFDNIKYFVGHKYQGDIGIGIYDPMSLHTPTQNDMQNNIKTLIRVFDVEKIWITYDSNISLFTNPASWEFFTQMHEVVMKYRERFAE